MLLAICPLPLIVFLRHKVESALAMLLAMLIVPVIARPIFPIK